VLKLVIGNFKQAKRLVVFVVGTTVLLFGVVLLVMPGPGILTIILGLAILATEFVWAQRLLKRFREKSLGLFERLFGTRAAGWLRKRWPARAGAQAAPSQADGAQTCELKRRRTATLSSVNSSGLR
jgi:hypothetical protein